MNTQVLNSMNTRSSSGGRRAVRRCATHARRRLVLSSSSVITRREREGQLLPQDATVVVNAEIKYNPTFFSIPRLLKGVTYLSGLNPTCF